MMRPMTDPDPNNVRDRLRDIACKAKWLRPSDTLEGQALALIEHLDFELRAKVAEIEIANGEIERLKADLAAVHMGWDALCATADRAEDERDALRAALPAIDRGLKAAAILAADAIAGVGGPPLPGWLEDCAADVEAARAAFAAWATQCVATSIKDDAGNTGWVIP